MTSSLLDDGRRFFNDLIHCYEIYFNIQLYNNENQFKPSEGNEWWVPLCEKAYAKFSGSYTKIIGGNTCWALTELTGGITVEMKNLTYENAVLANENVESQGFNLFNLFYRIQNRALICTSNLGLI